MPWTATLAHVSVVLMVDARSSRRWIACMTGSLYVWTSDALQSSRALRTRLSLSLKETSEMTMWLGAAAFLSALLIVFRISIGLCFLRSLFSPETTSVLSCRVGSTGRGGIGGGGGLVGFALAGLAAVLGFSGATTSVHSLSAFLGGFGALSLFQACWTIMVRASSLSPVLFMLVERALRSLAISLWSLVTVLRR